MTPGPRISQNGVSQNGHAQNGNGNGNGQAPPSRPPSPMYSDFDRSVILKQSPRWARYVVWGIVGVTVSTIAWACLAKFEQAIPAQGKLEPRGVVQPVQAPVGGVVKEIRVTEGETVEQGQILVTLDPTATASELRSLQEVQKKLIEENEYYRSQLADVPPVEGAPLTVSREVAGLTSNRNALQDENDLYQAILNGDGSNLSAQQLRRATASLGNFDAQVAQVQLEIEQLDKQLAQVDLQYGNAELALENARRSLDTAQSALEVETEILGRIEPLVEAGAVADLQRLQQEQEVKNRQQAVSDSQQLVSDGITEVNNLSEERQRINAAIVQAQEQLNQTVFDSERDLLERMDSNSTQIANIDSQLTKVIVENDKRLEEITGQIDRLEYGLENQELRAPLSGQVFNLQANQPGYVINATEPILEIVPGEDLVARVFITNQDIGFVTQRFYEDDEPLTVDVRIDSFPFSEFGDVEGTVVHVASDALPPDQINPVYRFPTEIELETQDLGDTLPLQSGMSVTANIKLRKRRVITILSDLFVRKIDSLRSGG